MFLAVPISIILAPLDIAPLSLFQKNGEIDDPIYLKQICNHFPRYYLLSNMDEILLQLEKEAEYEESIHCLLHYIQTDQASRLQSLLEKDREKFYENISSPIESPATSGSVSHCYLLSF